jgi:HemY protein
MIRVVGFLIAAGLLALGVVWLADRPGTGRDHLARLSRRYLGDGGDYRGRCDRDRGGDALVAAALLLRSPKLFSLAMRERKRRKGRDAISRGLIAIGAGDARAAQRFAANAEKSLPGEPLALLLRAQTAQLNPATAPAPSARSARWRNAPTPSCSACADCSSRRSAATMRVAARLYAEQAAKMRPRSPGPGRRCWNSAAPAGDWEGALAALERNMRKSGMLDPRRLSPPARRAAHRARARHRGETATPRAWRRRRLKLAPTLVPAAALAGRLLGGSGERRKAGKIIEKAWKANPHPDLADAYAHLRFGDSARDRLARARRWRAWRPGNVEGALAVARAALDAREFDVARQRWRRCSPSRPSASPC